ncbi:hypothetical protein LPC10_22240 [Methylorubrum sp. B1-46]|uniref:hypothetical protein n=1 Tax=Methylorubrum sp. B1-46 TaxID=2897334 RepID=UPI001E4B46D6|nr:hypothetical protein [Methylorubrum sp. B1-46]UGB25577.1 hypothetical protein LPC10_22240 [Methylorubrum sp. B1-46]
MDIRPESGGKAGPPFAMLVRWSTVLAGTVRPRFSQGSQMGEAWSFAARNAFHSDVP